MEKTERVAFDKAFFRRHGNSMKNVNELYADEKEDGKDFEMPEASDFENYDAYVNAEVLLPCDGEHM